jgi:cell wall-associated NlpC family hydrolase
VPLAAVALALALLATATTPPPAVQQRRLTPRLAAAHLASPAVAHLPAAGFPAAGIPAAGTAAAGTAAAGIPGARPSPVRTDRRLRKAWERLERVIEQYNSAREDLAGTEARATALTARIVALQAAMRDREARVGGIAARAYRAGGFAEVGTLLAATSPEQFAARLLIVRRLTTAQTRALGALTRARHGYEVARASLGSLAAEQGAHQRRLAEKKRHILAEIRRLERALGGRSWGAGPVRPPDGYVPAYARGKAGAAVRYAYRQLGKPYQWGGSGPSGYDCSGLTSAAWRAAGVSLPHNAAAQWNAVSPISRAELRQGDLVFYYADIYHVAIYVGAGRVVHAPNYGGRIRVERMAYAPIYGYGRP